MSDQSTVGPIEPVYKAVKWDIGHRDTNMHVQNYWPLSPTRIETIVERCKHVKSQTTTVYFKLGKLRRLSTYAQHVWGIIGHVTAEAGNTEGTDGAPPQVRPKLCGGRLRG